jgi:peroxiredoxin
MKQLIFTLFFVGWYCFAEGQEKNTLWRGEFEIGEMRIPFRFELLDSADDRGFVVFVNGLRRDSFSFSRQGDLIHIDLSLYDAEIRASEGITGQLSGWYRRQTVSGTQQLSFIAHPLQVVDSVGATDIVLSGQWTLAVNGEDQARVLLLEQSGKRLRGVVHTVTGDSRELEGELTDSSFYLSGFTGSKPMYLSGKLLPEGALEGRLGWEPDRIHAFAGQRSAAGASILPDPYHLTSLKPEFDNIDFSFPDLEGRMVSLSDEQFRDKVVVIEILGSWCPNCIDQIRFLAPWYRANKDRGVAIIGVGFELKDDLAFAQKTLGRLRDQLDITYPLLFGGYADKALAAEKFPALSQVLAFPTTIILDKKGNVRYIHTGYASESTGNYYTTYINEFNATIDALLSEPRLDLEGQSPVSNLKN